MAGRFMPLLEKMGVPMSATLTVPEALAFVAVPALVGKGIDTARTAHAIATKEQEKGIEAYDNKKEKEKARIRAEARKLVSNASISMPGGGRSIPVSIPFQDPSTQYSGY